MKNNTIDNPLIAVNSEKKMNKIIYTDPACFQSNSSQEKNQIKNYAKQDKKTLTNTIYNLDYEIQAHSKAILDQNISTGFTPNSRHTVEDFETGIGGYFQQFSSNITKNSNKITNNEDYIQYFGDLSKNVKYIDGGVGIIDGKSKDQGKEKNHNIDEDPQINTAISPFNPILLKEKNQPHENERKSKFLAFLGCLSDNCK